MRSSILFALVLPALSIPLPQEHDHAEHGHALVASSVEDASHDHDSHDHSRKRRRGAKRQGGLDFGTCPPPTIAAGLGIEGRKEFSFIPADTASFPHGSAQQIAIITDFLCDHLVNACGLNQQSPGHIACEAARASVGSGKDDGALADKFNQALGVTTDFKNAAGSTSAAGGGAAQPVAAPPAAPPANNGNTGNGGNAAQPVAAPPAAAPAAPPVNTGNGGGGAGALDFGTCPPPTIAAGLGIEGRTEFSFIPADTASFPHGSAQQIAIITDFLCDHLVNACGLNQQSPGHIACEAARASVGSGKDDGSLADKFNQALGVTTNFKNAAGSTTAAKRLRRSSKKRLARRSVKRSRKAQK